MVILVCGFEVSFRILNFIVIGCAGLAQSVERLTAEREVAAIPGAGPKLKVLK